jgi:hypothetical protein
MSRGSQATDGGHLLLSEQDKDELLSQEPHAAQWIYPFLMGDEFINKISRYCLWLDGISKTELKALPQIRKRIAQVKQMRLASDKEATRELASEAHLFSERRQPQQRFLAIPRVSSERRAYIPIGFLEPTIVPGDKIQTIEGASNYHFAVLNATMHNAWMRAVCGRLESRYSYSSTIVYNNYPWPCESTVKQKKAIERAGKSILSARAKHRGKSLAWLYNPETMPANLQGAHDAVDEAVDEAYGYEGANDDTSRVAFLFNLYQQLTTLLPADDES